MTLLSFWQPVHRFLVQNQLVIKNLFFLAYIACVACIGFGFYAFNNATATYLLLYGISGKFGTVALYLFLACLLPGIFQRFRILPLIGASIVLFRRQMGILMYLIAVMHSLFLSTIPAIMTNTLSIENFPLHSLVGVLALSLLFPVWITSNDFSQKKLGTAWKTIQRLTYVAMIAIFFHVAMVERVSAAVTLVVLLLEIASWVRVWFFKVKPIST